MPEHSITWLVGYISISFYGWKICQGPPLDDSRPWHNWTWTSGTTGDPVAFPRTWKPQGEIHTGSSSPTQDACTTVWSDPDDLDGDGDFNTGWPYYYDSGFFRCGPCACTAGEEQRWQTFRLLGEAFDTSYLSCTPCAAGRFRAAAYVFGAESPCAPCQAGSTSAAGATACSSCADGQHTSEEGASRCLPCPAGTSFRTTSVCDLYTAGYFGATEAATACTSCPPGLHYALRRPVCMLVVPSWSVWRGGWLRRPVVLASSPEKRARQLARRASQDTSPRWRVSQLVRLVRLVGMALGSLAGSAHLESTQKILANHAACVALSVPSLCLHVVHSAMPVLQDSMGATLPPPRARCATWVLSQILQALRRVPDAATMMTLVPPFGPRLGNVSAEGSFSGVDADGSSSVASCTCVEGARLSERGACVPCGEGLICPLVGRVQLQPGYFAAADDLGSVWRCPRCRSRTVSRRCARSLREIARPIPASRAATASQTRGGLRRDMSAIRRVRPACRVPRCSSLLVVRLLRGRQRESSTKQRPRGAPRDAW